ncbi:hypothetical protein CIB95_12970 [Lottiidibacillus patelloidae]|uniref:Uncharacterized protein n=1 Tax=Lottiidibacillus patelloidae TaxID=2670334 RepID=A0A263BRI2_9BACI|nr:hypothetical protein CIB95_12970 [Lottiidibacillus patelloidae]
MSLIGVLNIILQFLIVIILAFGLIQCKNSSFKEGIYFFLILLFHQLNSFFAPLYIDFVYLNFMKLSTGITYGEFTRLSFFINQVILCVALVYLVIGIRRQWCKYKVSN